MDLQKDSVQSTNDSYAYDLCILPLGTMLNFISSAKFRKKIEWIKQQGKLVCWFLLFLCIISDPSL